MSRFRFRAWRHNKMHNLEYFVIGELFTTIQADTYYERIIPNKDIAIMQSTGLKDCKEKEVFESDIVTPKICENHKYRPIGVITWYDDLVSFVIKYRDGTVQRLGMTMEMEDYLVLGNVYETPELLEVKESE